MLEEDKTRPAKQRHTAKRVFDRLRDEHGFAGGYTIVKDYLRSATLRGREMFVPLVCRLPNYVAYFCSNYLAHMRVGATA